MLDSGHQAKCMCYSMSDSSVTITHILYTSSSHSRVFFWIVIILNVRRENKRYRPFQESTTEYYPIFDRVKSLEATAAISLSLKNGELTGHCKTTESGRDDVKTDVEVKQTETS